MPTTNVSDRELLIRIDERTAALQTDNVEFKKDLKEKAPVDSVTKLAHRVSKTERKLSYICGGLIVIEALLRFVKLPGIPNP